MILFNLRTPMTWIILSQMCLANSAIHPAGGDQVSVDPFHVMIISGKSVCSHCYRVRVEVIVIKILLITLICVITVLWVI